MLCFPSVKQTAPARCLGMATVSLLGDAEKPRALPSVESCAFPSPQSQCGMLSLRKPSPFSRGDPASWSCAWVQPAGLISELPSSKCRGQMTLGTSVPGAGTWACSALCSSPWEMRMILQATMSEFESLGRGGRAKGQQWLLGLGCAWWGPGAAHLQQEHKGFGAGAVLGPVLAVATWKSRKSHGQNSQGSCGFLSQSLLLLLLTDPHPYVMQVCCLLICQICWLRCKWIETAGTSKLPNAQTGTSSGYP